MQAVDIADRTVTFGQNGSSVKVDYDLLIGADGVNSRVRCCHKCSQNLQADVASERHMRSIAGVVSSGSCKTQPSELPASPER